MSQLPFISLTIGNKKNIGFTKEIPEKGQGQEEILDSYMSGKSGESNESEKKQRGQGMGQNGY